MSEALLTVGTLIGIGYASLYPAARSNTAVSIEACTLRGQAGQLIAAAESSYALFGAKAGILSQILSMATECAEPGWDGDGTEPISQSAVATALDFIRALPDNVPLPEVAPEPDGALSFDWRESRYRMFSLSVGTGKRLAFAWLDGTDSGHGVTRFDGITIPTKILEAVRSLMGYASTSLWVT